MWMDQFDDKIDFLWEIAQLLRDDFKRGKYQDVVLPFTVLRRLDQVLEPTRQKVLAEDRRLEQIGINEEARDERLCRASGYAFYNTSKFNFARLLDDYPKIEANVKRYVEGYSENVRDLLAKFNFENTLDKLVEAGLLFKVVEEFKHADLHPDRVPNHAMGYIFEDLIRRFNEALDENPGEHFTPREIGALMAELLIVSDVAALKQERLIRRLSDPCCGTGGLLNIAKKRLLKINHQLDIYLFGQEVNPETYAICKADFLMASEDGRDAKNIKFGSVLSNEHPDLKGQSFHYQLANPPYGKKWKKDEDEVKTEAAQGDRGRFGAGTPRTTDGQFLFIQHMIKRMKPKEEGGGRVAVITNGSPLFSGDAGGNESDIRRFILENDLLEAIIALPEDLFYNTNIRTFVWVLSNHKEEDRENQVQLIDATSRDFWTPLDKSLGKKRRELADEHIAKIRQLYADGGDSEFSQMHDISDFGYRKISIQRPLRKNFEVTDERVARLRTAKAFTSLNVEAAGEDSPATLLHALDDLRGERWMDQALFIEALDKLFESKKITVRDPLRKAILWGLGEHDDEAIPAKDAKKLLFDPELETGERVPLGEDVVAYFEREVKPHVPDAVLKKSFKDKQDGELGKVGYEINFNRFFFHYSPPRRLESIEQDLKTLEEQIAEMVEAVVA
jgi:type I restriction enzyme M protein